MVDKEGQPFNAYVRFDKDENRPRFYRWNPDKKEGKVEAVAEENKTQVAVNNEGKTKDVYKRQTLHGNKYLRQMLTECAWSVTRSNKTFLGRKFNHLSKRMKSQKALVAIARKMLVIIYNVLKTGLPFDPTKNLQALLPD